MMTQLCCSRPVTAWFILLVMLGQLGSRKKEEGPGSQHPLQRHTSSDLIPFSEYPSERVYHLPGPPLVESQSFNAWALVVWHSKLVLEQILKSVEAWEPRTTKIASHKYNRRYISLYGEKSKLSVKNKQTRGLGRWMSQSLKCLTCKHEPDFGAPTPT